MSGLVKQEQAGEAATLERTRGGATFSPRIDILETEEELTLYGDMPGVTPDDLDIRFENRELSIYGKVAPRHEGVQYLYEDYSIGDFYRAFNIGEAVDTDKISAELKNGVLIVHLPKSESVKPRRIEVRSA